MSGEDARPAGIDPERVAELLVTPAQAGPGRRGSGYRVSESAVLTAAHVVRDAARVRVRFNANRPGQWLTDGRVDWSDPRIDAALVTITARAQDERQVPLVGFGRVAERDAVLACSVMGFPRFKLREDPAMPLDDGSPSQYRDSVHAVGTIAVLSNRREGTLEVSVTPPEQDPDPGRSPWEGMSGAAVWSAGRIIGLVAEHHRADGLGRLAATRVDHWYERLTPEQLGQLRILLPGLPTTRDGLVEVVPATPRSAGNAARIDRPGQLITQIDPLEVEVHPAIESTTTRAPLSALPTYIPRPHDDVLRQVVADATSGRSRLAVLVGGSSTGKTRACWEAIQALPSDWRLWHPIEPGRPQAAARDLAKIAPRTVVWLNETHHYLLTPDSDLGEEIAAGLRELLRTPGRGPVLILGTMWPEYWAALTTIPSAGSPDDPHAQARALLIGAGIAIPDTFHGPVLELVRAAANSDPRLAEAHTHAEGGEITQYLAGVPVLVERYDNAPAPARALVEAAMDARRIGHSLALPAALLKAAAPGYLTERQWDDLSEDWFEQSIAYTSAPCRGTRGPLTRRRPSRDSVSTFGPCFRLSDYLEQMGRATRRTVSAPHSLWDGLVAHGARTDLNRLASEARRRGLYRYAFQLYGAATDAGDSRALAWAAGLLRQTGRSDEAITWYRRAADAGIVSAVPQLAALLGQAGRIDEAITWYEYAAEAGLSSAIDSAAELLRQAGRIPEAIAWYRRAADGGSISATDQVAEMLRGAGRSDEAIKWLLERPTRDRHADLTKAMGMTKIAGWLADDGRIEEAIAWYERAFKAGWPFAVLEAAVRLQKAGRTEEAIAWLKDQSEIADKFAVDLARRYLEWNDLFYSSRGQAKQYAAQLLLDMGRTGEAIFWYKRAAEAGSATARGKHSAHSHVVISSVGLAGVTGRMPVLGVARACRA